MVGGRRGHTCKLLLQNCPGLPLLFCLTLSFSFGAAEWYQETAPWATEGGGRWRRNYSPMFYDKKSDVEASGARLATRSHLRLLPVCTIVSICTLAATFDAPPPRPAFCLLQPSFAWTYVSGAQGSFSILAPPVIDETGVWKEVGGGGRSEGRGLESAHH